MQDRHAAELEELKRRQEREMNNLVKRQAKEKAKVEEEKEKELPSRLNEYNKRAAELRSRHAAEDRAASRAVYTCDMVHVGNGEMVNRPTFNVVARYRRQEEEWGRLHEEFKDVVGTGKPEVSRFQVKDRAEARDVAQRADASAWEVFTIGDLFGQDRLPRITNKR